MFQGVAPWAARVSCRSAYISCRARARTTEAGVRALNDIRISSGEKRAKKKAWTVAWQLGYARWTFLQAFFGTISLWVQQQRRLFKGWGGGKDAADGSKGARIPLEHSETASPTSKIHATVTRVHILVANLLEFIRCSS